MLTFSPELKAALAATPDKTKWGLKLNEMLGNARRLRCFRDADAAAVNPYITGVEFLNIGNTGDLTLSSGAVTGFGILSGATVRKAADLSTGSAILRIEGNGHWMQGSLGLASRNQNPDKTKHVDFTLPVNPTATAGYAMASTIRPPRLMPSGTGPLAPPADDKRPVVVELVSYKDEKNPVVVGSLTLNVRDEDMVFQHPKLAAEMGDVRVTKASNSIVFDEFEFGAVLLSMNPVLNAMNSEVVHELLVTCKPYNTWETYPAYDTYNDLNLFNVVKPKKTGAYSTNLEVSMPGAIADKITVVAIDANTFSVNSKVRGQLPNATVGVAYYGGLADVSTIEAAPFYFKITNPVIETKNADGTVTYTPDPFVPGDTLTFEVAATYKADRPTDITQPPPFKINVRRLDNTILHVFQMRDGLPINSPKLPQVRQEFEGLRPLFNCGMMLPWRSHPQKYNSKMYEFSPKPTWDSVRTTAAQQPSSFNGAVPLLYGYNVNSQNHYNAAPRWALGWGSGAVNDAQDPMNDPVVFDCRTYYTASTGPGKNLARAIGWDYEPGSISGHDWYTGPGGPRIDRAVMASPIAQYLWKPNGIRLKDNSTFKDNMEAWCKAYFNHSCHYVRDVISFETLPINEIMNGQWSQANAYYGSSNNYVPGGAARHVSVFAVGKGSSRLKKDRKGNAVWGGWATDQLHCYAQPGWAALLFNSPMYVIANKHRFIATWLSQLLGVNPKITAGFMERNGAWRWLSFAMSWVLGTKHSLGIAREDIEERWRIDMENIHRDYVIPSTDPTHPDYNKPERATLRGLGIMSNTKPTVKAAKDYMPPVEDTGEEAEPGDTIPAPGNVHGYTINSNGLTWYIAHVFLLMKTSGSFDVMYNKNQKCKEVLDFMIQCLDKFCIDFILDAKGRCEGGYPYLSRPVLTTEPVVFPPTSWLEWATDHFPAKGQEDWMHGEDGARIKERDVGQHNRAMWAQIRTHYFKEFPHPRLAAALAEYQRYYDERRAVVEDRIARKTGGFDIRNGDWNYRVAAFHFPEPPAAT